MNKAILSAVGGIIAAKEKYALGVYDATTRKPMFYFTTKKNPGHPIGYTPKKLVSGKKLTSALVFDSLAIARKYVAGLKQDLEWNVEHSNGSPTNDYSGYGAYLLDDKGMVDKAYALNSSKELK